MQLNQKNLQELKRFTSHACLVLQFVPLLKMPFTISKETVNCTYGTIFNKSILNKAYMANFFTTKFVPFTVN